MPSPKTILLFIVLMTTIAAAQWETYEYRQVQPRMMLGGQIALFRISLSDFEEIYTSRWGESFGGFLGVRAFGAHYITFKYGSFQKNGRTGKHPETGRDLQDARWNEQWYKLGLRVHPTVENRWGSYYGFGIAAYDITETEELSIFDKSTTEDENELGTGFYLEAGFDYFMHEKIALFFDIEIASGGVRGTSGFEAMSVGGWKFAGGISFWPF